MHTTHAVRSLFVAALLVLAGCTPPKNSAYLNRGGPESLLDVSSEVVTLSAANAQDMLDLTDWIERDSPTRAELNCLAGDTRCAEAKKILELEGIPFVKTSNSSQSVTLVYERILARDCNSRYVDNRDNFYNTNHPNFGCSVAANIVQHVTDKQEFINPNLSDDPSAARAVNDIKRAYTPRDVVKPYDATNSVVNAGKSE